MASEVLRSNFLAQDVCFPRALWKLTVIVQGRQTDPDTALAPKNLWEKVEDGCMINTTNITKMAFPTFTSHSTDLQTTLSSQVGMWPSPPRAPNPPNTRPLPPSGLRLLAASGLCSHGLRWRRMEKISILSAPMVGSGIGCSGFHREFAIGAPGIKAKGGKHVFWLSYNL